MALSSRMHDALHWYKSKPCFKCDPETVVDIYELRDARGISCGLVCEGCAETRIKRYRPEIFADAGYLHDEPLEEDR